MAVWSLLCPCTKDFLSQQQNSEWGQSRPGGSPRATVRGDASSSQLAHKLLNDSSCMGIRIALARDLIKAIKPLNEENPQGAHGEAC